MTKYALERGNHQPNLRYVHLARFIFCACLYVISPLRLMELPIIHPNDFPLRQGRDMVGQYNGIDVPVSLVVEFLDMASRVVVIYDSFVGIHDNTLANWRKFALILLSHDTHIISYSRQKVNTPWVFLSTLLKVNTPWKIILDQKWSKSGDLVNYIWNSETLASVLMESQSAIKCLWQKSPIFS